ncbi:MAG: phosphoribosylanthranilate isomerase [Actinomycetota bacterium]|nr:phosphoribosylanthranilate isomerase [Actinomycetota bacterium]
MFVKVCGLRTQADVKAAADAGADAVGFVFAESVRKISVDDARRLAARTPANILTVGVFRDIPAAMAGEIATTVHLDAIQLHGDYPRAAFAELADHPAMLIRATALKPETNITVGAYGEELLLLDSPAPGSGKRWDLAELTNRPTGKWLLAGGLTPANVATAIATANPWGVDVSSGVESSRGVKDPGLIREFVAAARESAPIG